MDTSLVTNPKDPVSVCSESLVFHIISLDKWVICLWDSWPCDLLLRDLTLGMSVYEDSLNSSSTSWTPYHTYTPKPLESVSIFTNLSTHNTIIHSTISPHPTLSPSILLLHTYNHCNWCEECIPWDLSATEWSHSVSWENSLCTSPIRRDWGRGSWVMWEFRAWVLFSLDSYQYE
jgi:hypothetical protein